MCSVSDISNLHGFAVIIIEIVFQFSLERDWKEISPRKEKNSKLIVYYKFFKEFFQTFYIIQNRTFKISFFLLNNDLLNTRVLRMTNQL